MHEEKSFAEVHRCAYCQGDRRLRLLTTTATAFSGSNNNNNHNNACMTVMSSNGMTCVGHEGCAISPAGLPLVLIPRAPLTPLKKLSIRSVSTPKVSLRPAKLGQSSQVRLDNFAPRQPTQEDPRSLKSDNVSPHEDVSTVSAFDRAAYGVPEIAVLEPEGLDQDMNLVPEEAINELEDRME